MFSLILLLFIPAILKAQDVQVPSLTGRVVDLTGTLKSYQINAISTDLEEFEKRKGSQIVVLLLPTTGDETIEQFGIKVAEKWKIGRSKVDDGVILIVAKNDRKVRIEVGYGLEGAIPDAYAKRIIEEIIKPQFRSGNFDLGISDAVDAIIGLVDGEPLPEPSKAEDDNDISGISGFLFVFGIIVMISADYFLKKYLGKWKGLIVGALIIFVLTVILINWIVAVIITVISLIFLNAGGGGGRGGGGYYGGGYSGGGGFSGGGGSFGGGGASGGW
ncbi:YgcG family protein [Fulvivirga sp. 2943]|uniref:YgcG family protein n=1 Tax=Fulvivirga sediminis TaxID=2803949 RepID=A0A937K2Q9_9BACT|nr:YgcG family protein [Fulvivirga sediminis]